MRQTATFPHRCPNNATIQFLIPTVEIWILVKMFPLEYQHDGSSFLLHCLSFSGVVLVALLIHALRKGYQVRKKFKTLEAQGIVSSLVIFRTFQQLIWFEANNETFHDLRSPRICRKTRFLSPARCPWRLLDDDDPRELAWTLPTVHKVFTCRLHRYMAIHRTHGDISQSWCINPVHHSALAAQGVWAEAHPLTVDQEPRLGLYGGWRMEDLA